MPLTGWPAYSDDTGTGQDGTVITDSFLDAIKASVEATVFGDANPSVGADAIIDEVVTARGSMGSLDARLDVVLNNNGTFKAFNPQPTFHPGAGAVADGTVAGGINAQSSAVANSGGAETNLMSYTLQANHFNVNNKAINIKAWGTLAANANSKTIRFYVGATLVLTFNTSASDLNWKADIWLIRSSATAGKAMSRIEVGPKTDSPITDNRLQHEGAIAHTWTSSALLRFTGQGVASSDIVQDMMVISADN
jgi:hypothetical protein